ncbi:hypothetical protein L9F63_018410 [Diploptera punctata]|uniref:Uncharacterized protein n=1 Tax=Diploptera punctata TaxID=6984 RepID=A0AAD7ZX16_DIPPU|nr:hypothetical protein L9F63_018410 [Diploptera punctata]
MTGGEFDTLRRKNCKLLWLCDKCKHELIKEKKTDNIHLEELTSKVDALTEFLNNKLGTLIEEKIKQVHYRQDPQSA